MIKSNDKTKYSIFYSNSNAETIIYQSDIDDVFESMYSAIISSIQKSLGKDSGWNIDSDLIKIFQIASPQLGAVISNYEITKGITHPRKV